MARGRRRRGTASGGSRRWRLPAGAGLLLVVALVAVVLGGARHGTRGAAGAGGPGTAAAGGPAAAPDRSSASIAPASVTVSVSPAGAGRAIPSGFLGFSFEFDGVRAYTGSDPAHVNPVLVALMRNLTPGQAPVLRIGGDSTDASYVPVPGVRPPIYVHYRLTPGWMATTGALARALGARLIMGLNLVANEPALDAAEARSYESAFGSSIDALEIGNEPNVYGKIALYRTVFGIPLAARPSSYGYADFRRDFRAVAAAVAAVGPGRPLAGPALAAGPVANDGAWLSSIPGFLRRDARVSTMTVHRYPLRNCYVPPRSPQYPSIPHLLSPYATITLAESLRPWIRIAHGAHRVLRLDELNSAACRGKAGVSDTFASALWVTDALFALARAGVDGVNMHTLPDTAYELFSFSRRGGRWQADVHPVYYGLQLFSEAAPAGARLLGVTVSGSGPDLSAWATRAPDGVVRVVLINKSERRDRTVTVRLPAAMAATGAAGATVERLLAPSVAAKTGVQLGGRSYGAATATGRLGPPRVSTVTAAGGAVRLSVPHGSSALLTFGG